jgi:predicted HTH transcriptional regulator
MMKKPASQVTEADLQLLITNSVSERRNIDYKRDLPGTTDGDKKEFLADVSSFANAIGGFLIFGITETGGLPTAITGTKAVDLDREAQRIDNLLASGLQPRIRYELAWIKTVQGPVLLIEIDKSLVGPHRVILGDHGHFYARNSTGKYRLDVSDLRQAFGASARLLDRVRDFHADRLLRVARNEVPVPIC